MVLEPRRCCDGRHPAAPLPPFTSGQEPCSTASMGQRAPCEPTSSVCKQPGRGLLRSIGKGFVPHKWGLGPGALAQFSFYSCYRAVAFPGEFRYALWAGRPSWHQGAAPARRGARLWVLLLCCSGAGGSLRAVGPTHSTARAAPGAQNGALELPQTLQLPGIATVMVLWTATHTATTLPLFPDLLYSQRTVGRPHERLSFHNKKIRTAKREEAVSSAPSPRSVSSSPLPGAKSNSRSWAATQLLLGNLEPSQLPMVSTAAAHPLARLGCIQQCKDQHRGPRSSSGFGDEQGFVLASPLCLLRAARSQGAPVVLQPN